MSFQDRSFQLERAQSKANSWNSWLWNSTAQVCIWTLHWFVGRAVGQKKYRGRTSPRHLKRRGPALLQTHLTYKHIAVHFRLFFFWRWQLIRYHVPDGWTGNRFFCNAHPWMQTMVPPDNVRSWLVARVAIVAIFSKLFWNSCIVWRVGSLLWQNKIGRTLFFAKKHCNCWEAIFFKNAVAQSR